MRYIGCSNFPAWRLVEDMWTSDRLRLACFVSLQPHYNLAHRAEYECELEAVCMAYGLGVIPYAPLAAGYLAGKYRRGAALPEGSRGARSTRVQALLEGQRGQRLLWVLERLGGRRGMSLSQMALGWLLTRPSVTSPIIGPRSVEQLRDNLGAAGLHLEPGETRELDEVSKWRSQGDG